MPAAAQARPYVGLTVGAAIRERPDPNEPGGAAANVAAALGFRVSPRMSVDGELSLDGELSNRYEYLPHRDESARVTVTGHYRTVGFNLRYRVAGPLELVGGTAISFRQKARHAEFVGSGRTYFADRSNDTDLVPVVGADVPLSVGRRISVMPTFRVVAVGHPIVRVGVGMRVAF
jgi:hypothetical protein